MRRYSYSFVCPYYIRDSARSVTCEGLVEGASQALRFSTDEAKNDYAVRFCSAYDYVFCPHAIAQERRYDEKLDCR